MITRGLDKRTAWAMTWPAVLLILACGLLTAGLSWNGRRWVAIPVGAGIYLLYLFLLNLRHKRAAGGSPPEQRGGHDGKADLPGLFEKQRAALRKDNLESVPSLVRMIIDPAHFRTRTVESVSLQGRVISQQVTIEFQLPSPPAGGPERDGGAGEIYVPALLVRKPELIDSLAITDSQGQTVTVLSFEETAELLAVALHFLVITCTAPGREDGRSPRTQRELERSWQAEALLLELIYGFGNRADVDKVIAEAFALLGLPGSAGTERVTWLREFVQMLSQAYPVIAVLPHQDHRRAVISYRRTLIPSLSIANVRGRLRLALGLRPLKVGVDTALAHNSKSYHLQIDGPGTQYLMEQTLRCASCRTPLTRAGVILPPGRTCPVHHQRFQSGWGRPYFEMRGKRGQSYAHLYMRGFARVRGENLVLSASFGESPPGTLASATITAAVTCLLIGAIGHAEATGIANDSDIPPLLLALPAVAASWFGFNADGEAVLRSSLAARCSLFVSAIASLIAGSLFLVTERPEKPVQSVEPDVFGMHLPSWWGLLFVIALVNVLSIAAQLVVRSWSYRRLLLRRENDAAHTYQHRLE
ncbi:hypothetical protein AGRA3207_003411 [Actinomadura graeca]|uniref:Uncharacterized protein n=1 Tax=Actinomadura graeca TaxID=2750812 RepID=A0ABX8QUB9_9ACTN|nr:hypothetical protein [Actinomadura graeca]QXJ22416.1 hypothetical protein AGRA3207_003411 [Actinomadura graeca]